MDVGTDVEEAWLHPVSESVEIVEVSDSAFRVLTALLHDGADTVTLSRRVGLAENTVKVHMKALFQATGCRSRTALAVAVLRGDIKVVPR